MSLQAREDTWLGEQKLEVKEMSFFFFFFEGTLTPELARFCQAMVDGAGDCRTLLHEAAAAHVAYMRDAGQGRGCDRHLLAFRLLAKESNLSHPFLSDPAMQASSHWRLSTSQLAVKNIFVGFGPVVPDGYGVCYQVWKKERKQDKNKIKTELS